MTVHFAHDDTTIFYPTAPGRVYIITFAALADCDGSDEDYSDSTEVGDIEDMILTTTGPDAVEVGRNLAPLFPGGKYVPDVFADQADGILSREDLDDAVEQWADWCDRDSARLDSLDACRGSIHALATVESATAATAA